MHEHQPEAEIVSTVQSALLFECEVWALPVKDKKALDGVYTKMLRAALNVSWEDHVTNVDLCGCLPRLSDTPRRRPMRLASRCVTHPELTASEMILWEPRKEVIRTIMMDREQ